MNGHNWIPVIYEPKTNTHTHTHKKKRKKKAFSSSDETPKLIIHPNSAQTRIYSIMCWVKYLVDSSENIWGCHDEYMFVEISSASSSMADRRELQGSDLAAEPQAVARARPSDFGLRRCVGWCRRHRRDSPQLGSSRRSSNRFQLRFCLEFLSRFGKCFLRCFKPLEMDSGDLSFAFV